MAAENNPQSPGATSGTPPRGRDRLARMVVVGSFLTLFLLVAALISLANSSASNAADKAFNSILPALARQTPTRLHCATPTTA